MTQLVIHTGMPLTAGSRVREQLVACREPLERAGVAVVGKDGAIAWDRAVRQVLGGEAPQVLKRIVRRKLQEQLSAILLSSESAAGTLGSDTNVLALRAFSHDHAVPVKVVLVVREQLQLLNELYCRQVMALETSVGFEKFVGETMAATTLELGASFAPLVDAPDIELVAVPYSRLDARLPAGSVLAAAGLPGEAAIAKSGAATADPPGAEPTAEADAGALPGPVLLTATRLLHKRLTRLGVVRKRRPHEVAAAAAVMRERAAEAGWDDTVFWGWPTDLAAATAERFALGNAAFADRVWGTPWPEAPPERARTRQDLAAAPPAVVSDAMTMIHRVVDELTTPAAAPVESADSE